MEPRVEVRKVGVKRVGLSLLGCIVLYGVSLLVESVLPEQSHLKIMYGAVGMGLIFAIAYACIGFVEIVTGRPFSQLAKAWMELAGWQRGVLGVIIILGSIAFATLVGIMVVGLM
jgi:hypothetical protein